MEQLKDLLPQVVASVRLTKEEPQTIQASASLPKPFDWEFETLGDSQLISMLSAARKFCADLRTGKNPHWLCLLGTSGSGKTHLAKKISEFFRRELKGLLVPGQDVIKTRWCMDGGFISWRKTAGHLRNGEHGRFTDICSDYFVAIDDIGAEHETAFITSKLDELFDARQQKWTAITANLSLEQIGNRMDPRIASRMLRHNSVIIDINVLDYNLRRR